MEAAEESEELKTVAGQEDNHEVSDDENEDEMSHVSEDETDEEQSMDSEIKVDFEVFPPHESDFDGIKKLLHQVFLKDKNINTSTLTKYLIQDEKLTLVIKQEEDEDDEEEDLEVYGVSSLLDLRKKDTPINGVLDLIIKRLEGCKDATEVVKASFKSAVETKETSFFVLNERFVNLPAQLSLPCFRSLLEVVKKMPEAQHAINFFMICKIMKFKNTVAKEGKTSDKKKAKTEEGIIYQNQEEEIFFESVSNKDTTELTFFDYCVADQCDSNARSGDWDDDDIRMIPYRRVLKLSKDQFFAAVESLEKELTVGK